MVYYNAIQPLTPTTWHHLAAVFDGSRMQFFVDGEVALCEIYIDDGNKVVLQSESPALELHVVWPDFGLVIGGNSSNSDSPKAYPFCGRIASVMVSPSVRYATAFKTQFKLQTDEVTEALYKLKAGEDPILDELTKSPPAFRHALH